MTKLYTLLPLCLWLCLCGGTTFAQSQTPSNGAPAVATASSPEVIYLRSIVEEVRLLRVSMQQMMGNTLRTRILVEQLAKQQARVDVLLEEITHIKTFISQAQDSKRGEDEMQEMETRIRESGDPQERARLQHDYATFKRTLERERAALQKEAFEQQTRQTQLENSLRQEQAKLAELQSQLDALDQELERLLVETKP
ncbi:MAG TPA: hypothetical protein PK012_34305, partial [Blastocatellia bacterium]|nr:hypothetical protein [Blastocatellia bacterium]